MRQHHNDTEDPNRAWSPSGSSWFTLAVIALGAAWLFLAV